MADELKLRRAWIELTSCTYLGVMLSLARSRYTVMVHFIFLRTHAVGIMSGTIYSTSTPDLFPNNLYHKIGWVVTILIGIHVFTGPSSRCSAYLRDKKRSIDLFLSPGAP